MRFAFTLEGLLFRIETLLAALSLAGILAISLIEIIARNIWHTGIPSASVFIQYLVLWVTFLGAVLAVQGRHIKIDVATVLLSDAMRRKLEIPICGFSALICAILCWAAGRFWISEWQAAAAGERWLAAMALVFPLCFGLLSLHFVLRMFTAPAVSNPAKPTA